MRWVTRARPKTDRIACPWLIRRFIDPDAEILYVPAEDVLDVASRDGARSFDAPGAEFTHRDGKCSFEVLIEDFALGADPALVPSHGSCGRTSRKTATPTRPAPARSDRHRRGARGAG
jgi:hypothetical protein